MTIGSSHNGLEPLGRSALENTPSMSLTSHLAHHPLGAAVARSPHPASGGGGEGWSILLVGQSERGSLAAASIDRPRMRLVRTFGAVRQASARMRTRPPDNGLALSAGGARVMDRANSCWG